MNLRADNPLRGLPFVVAPRTLIARDQRICGHSDQVTDARWERQTSLTDFRATVTLSTIPFGGFGGREEEEEDSIIHPETRCAWRWRWRCVSRAAMHVTTVDLPIKSRNERHADTRDVYRDINQLASLRLMIWWPVATTTVSPVGRAVRRSGGSTANDIPVLNSTRHSSSLSIRSRIKIETFSAIYHAQRLNLSRHIVRYFALCLFVGDVIRTLVQPRKWTLKRIAADVSHLRKFLFYRLDLWLLRHGSLRARRGFRARARDRVNADERLAPNNFTCYEDSISSSGWILRIEERAVFKIRLWNCNAILLSIGNWTLLGCTILTQQYCVYSVVIVLSPHYT